MINNLTMTVERDGHTFMFIMPGNAPLGSAYDAAWDCLQRITQHAAEITDKAKRQEEAPAAPAEAV